MPTANMITETVDDGSTKVCGFKLRKLCFIIGYLHLVSIGLDLLSHLLTVGITSDGFQCDFNMNQFIAIPWIYLEPILLLINLGTHGFYPFPGIFRLENPIYLANNVWTKCYVGMVHIYLNDILNFSLNLIWLRIVISYIGALKKKNPSQMFIFLILSVVRVIIVLVDFVVVGYTPRLYDMFHPAVYCVLKVVDIIIQICILHILFKYFKEMRAQNKTESGQNPRPYIDYLVDASLRGLSALHERLEVYKRKMEPVNQEEKKPLPEAIEIIADNSA